MAAQRVPPEDYLSDDGEKENTLLQEIDIPICDGIPRRLWCTKLVVLLNATKEPMAEGICHSVRSKHVMGNNGPLGDSQVTVQISCSLRREEVPEDWKYSLHAWPIDRVILNGASLKDYDLRDEYNRQQARLLQLSSSGKRSYASVVRNPPLPLRNSVRAVDILT